MTRSSNSEEFTLVTSTDMDVEKMSGWYDVWTDLAGPLAEEVSFSRLRDAIKTCELGRLVPDEVIIGALELADENHDGLLQKSEFMALVQNTPRSSPLRRLLREAAWCVVPESERDFSKRSYFEYYSCLPPPLFIPIISLVQVAAFIYYAVDMNVPIKAMSPCPTYSPLVYDPARRYEAWRYVTYMTVHSGWLHLLSNLIMQLVFGVILEIVHGPGRISVIYLSGVVCGALATSVSTPWHFLAGASGGVYAIQYAHLGNLVINWAEIRYPVVQAVVIAVISLIDMSYSIYDTFFVSDPSNTGHLAHIGGALCGLLLGVCVLWNLKKQDWERYCVIGAAMMSVLVPITVLVNIFPTSYNPENDYITMANRELQLLQNAQLFNVVVNWKELRYPVVQAVVIAVISLFEMSLTIYETFVSDPPNASNLVYIGGDLWGVLLGVFVLMSLIELDWDRYCVIWAAVMLSVLVLITVLVNIFNTSYYPDNDYTSMADLRENWMAEHQSRYYYPGQ